MSELLTGSDRETIARARKLAFAGTHTGNLRDITHSPADFPPAMVYDDALRIAQALLLDLTVLAERLAAEAQA